jgi:hypothetical protein
MEKVTLNHMLSNTGVLIRQFSKGYQNKSKLNLTICLV